MCALAYVLLLEDLYRRIATETQAALFARAMGENVEIPDPVAIRARFDALLAEEPQQARIGQPADRSAVLAEAFGMKG